ncbi:MAG: cupin domain-containing protein, partial [Myxococcota bacterium]
MSYQKAFFDLSQGSAASSFPEELKLKNVGFSVYVLDPGEGFDYLHNHREQEEVYLCIEGTAQIVVGADDETLERIDLKRGEAVKVDPETLRAIGNASNARTVLVIAGG